MKHIASNPIPDPLRTPSNESPIPCNAAPTPSDLSPITGTVRANIFINFIKKIH